MLRVSRELRNRSGIGAMFVNRSATGDLSRTGDWNRTWGADARVGVGEHFTMAGFGARTETPGLTGRDFAYNVDSEYDDGKHRAGFEYGRTGEAFNPEVGFLEKEGGYSRMFFRYHETMRQQKIRDWGFREWQPHVQYTRYDYLDGGLQTAELHLDNHWDWENGYRIDTALNGTWEGFREPFEIYPGVIVPVGEHGGLRFRMNANTDRRKWISWQLRVGRRHVPDRHAEQPQPQCAHPRRRAVHGGHQLDVSIDLAAGGRVPHQPGQHAGDLQLHAVGVHPEPGAVQRPHRPLVNEPAVPPARDRGHRALRRLQQHREPRRARPDQSRLHRQVRASVRSAALIATLTSSALLS